jgi:hypothetical protein
MQAKNYDGSFGPVEPFTGEVLGRTLANPNVQHVEVFEGTEENIKARQKLFSVKKRYQKVKAIKPKTDLNLQIEIPKKKKR